MVSFKEDTEDFHSYDLDFMLTGTYVDEGPNGHFEFDECMNCLSGSSVYDLKGGTIQKEDWNDSKVNITLSTKYVVPPFTETSLDRTIMIDEI